MAKDVATDRDELRRDDVYGTTAPLAGRAALYDFLERPQDIIEWVLGFVEPVPVDGLVVDVGCGDGKYTSRLAAAGRRVMALDLSPGMARATADTLDRAVVVVGDVQALPLPSGRAAAVVAPHMLYHPPDIALAVREIARVLVPDGVLVALTNGEGHLARLWETVMTARADLAGIPYERYRPSSDRFSLENGAPLLTPHVSVERHVLRNRVVVPSSGPLVRYVETVRPFFEARFASGLPWNGLLAAFEARVDEVIEREGAWIDTTESGVFVGHRRSR